MAVHKGVGEDINFHARVGFLEPFVEEHHRALIVSTARSEDMVSHTDQQKPKGRVFVGVQVEASYDLRQLRPTRGGSRVGVYWFSVNWKFAFGALACDGFEASEITL
jgi:hypothetical protein